MSKRVLLIGHCGPDNSYLRMAVRSAVKDAEVRSVDTKRELREALDDNGGYDLLMFNRRLGCGFDEDEGVEMIRWMKRNYPTIPMMLISNFDQAQAAAVEAGAVPGFGKDDIGSAKVTQVLRDALNSASVDT